MVKSEECGNSRKRPATEENVSTKKIKQSDINSCMLAPKASISQEIFTLAARHHQQSPLLKMLLRTVEMTIYMTIWSVFQTLSTMHCLSN